MEGTHAMTLRLPGDVYERLRVAAFSRRVPMAQIITEGTAARLDEIEQEADTAAPGQSTAGRAGRALDTADKACVRGARDGHAV